MICMHSDRSVDEQRLTSEVSLCLFIYLFIYYHLDFISLGCPLCSRFLFALANRLPCALTRRLGLRNRRERANVRWRSPRVIAAIWYNPRRHIFLHVFSVFDASALEFISAALPGGREIGPWNDTIWSEDSNSRVCGAVNPGAAEHRNQWFFGFRLLLCERSLMQLATMSTRAHTHTHRHTHTDMITDAVM